MKSYIPGLPVRHISGSILYLWPKRLGTTLQSQLEAQQSPQPGQSTGLRPCSQYKVVVIFHTQTWVLHTGEHTNTFRVFTSQLSRDGLRQVFLPKRRMRPRKEEPYPC